MPRRDIENSKSSSAASDIVDNEDIDISDPADQKRLRNRLAQRKYRKNLKRRIEDLEKRAAGTACAEASAESACRHLGRPDPATSPTATARTSSTPLLMTPTLLSGRDDPFSSLVVNHSRDAQDQVVEQSSSYDFRLQASPLDDWSQGPTFTRNAFPGTMIDHNFDAKPFWSEHLTSVCNDVVGCDKTSSDLATQPVDQLLRRTRGSSIPSDDFTSGQRRSQTPSVEEDMTNVLESAQQAGFESFDTAVSQYYTGSFSEGTRVRNVQKLSRRRELPRVLRDLRESTRRWTQWESDGYNDEVIQSAENILVDEFNRVLHGASALDPDTRAQSPVLELAAEFTTIPTIQIKIEDKMPHLWAVVMALTSDANPEAQRKRYQILLECISNLANGTSAPGP